MANIPRAVLSEHFQERLAGRKLISAVFLTFRFDPAFFEQEVLPVFLDTPLSHVTAIKLVQLEDPIRSLAGSISVYYDENGLVPEARAAKLDIRRVAVRHRTGIFHPKNVFALVEDVEADETGHHPRALLVGCLSANLTQAGWWENVEVGHVEEIREGDFTLLRDDVLRFIEGLERRVGEKAADGHAALRSVRQFLRGTDQRTLRTSDGRLHTRFYGGAEAFIDFLSSAVGSSLHGMNLEVLSPYFDGAQTSEPLAALIAYAQPREVRVFLPRKESGEALCDAELYEWVRAQPSVSWSKLPRDIMKRSKNDDAKRRFMHAKVYRFFNAKREVLFVGSVNLTSAAHQNGGNLETGFLVELDLDARPEWWTEPDSKHPLNFDRQLEDDGVAASGGTPLSLRYWWDSKRAEAFWDNATPSPPLSVESVGTLLFKVPSLPPRRWTALNETTAEALQRVLLSTSILSVVSGEDSRGVLLVQEEGMSHRPSLLHTLSPSEILRYWALLTLEQRAGFLEAKAPELALLGEGAALVSSSPRLGSSSSLFDRFAGIFHAFGCTERAVRAALGAGKEKEATYKLFGRKYDSLGHLLTRIADTAELPEADLVADYVIVLCTKQLIQELRRDFKEYWDAHREDDAALRKQLDGLARIRERIVERDPANMPTFLDWFERWFLKRAAPVEAPVAA